MNAKPTISRGEMEVVRALWKINEGGVGQIFDAMPARGRPDYSTVQTYIRRLEAKGVLRSRRVGRNKLYRSRIRPNTVIGDAVSDLVNQVFEGEPLPLMRHLLANHSMTNDEIQQLRDLLDEAEAEGNDD